MTLAVLQGAPAMNPTVLSTLSVSLLSPSTSIHMRFMAGPKQCFISYSHHDHQAFDRLFVHLKPIAYLYGFNIWHDRRLKPGDYWSNAIRTEIEQSDVFIALTTNDFLASDYILRHELPAMIERHQKHNALLIPVIYRNSCWRSFFGNYIEVTPKNNKGNLVPVWQWRDREDALAVVANALASSIEDWFGVKPRELILPSPGTGGKVT